MIKNSMILEFELKKQTLIRKDVFRPVANSKNYLYAHFTFDDDWDELEKYALFNYGNLTYKTPLNENNMCKVDIDVIKANGFFVSIVGEKDNINVLITANKLLVGVTENDLQNGVEAPVRFINSNTLNYKKDGDVLLIDIPNIYGTKLELDNANGIIKLLGRKNEDNDNYVILSQIDLPTEKIITNIRYNEETESLIFSFENSPDIVVNIGDIFNIDNYYTKEQTDNIFVKQVIGKQLSTNDFTNEEKEKLQILENYDDTEIKNLLEGKQNALATDNTINLVNDEISVNTDVIATKDYVHNSFATNDEMTTMLEEVFS